MADHIRRRCLTLFLSCCLLLSSVAVGVSAEIPAGDSPNPPEVTPGETFPSTETTAAPSEESTIPSEETSLPPESTAAETSAPTEASSDVTEASTDPTDTSKEPTESTQATTVPSEEPTDPTQTPTDPTQTPTSPSEEPAVPSEEHSEEPSETPTESPSDPTTNPTEPDVNPAAIPAEAEQSGPGLYFGLLHSHSRLSSGQTPVEDLFRAAAGTEQMDFFAVTDHSDSFDGADAGSLGVSGSSVSTAWKTGKAAAAAVSGPAFAGIFGFEMSWPERMQLGHISVFGTPGFQSWTQDAYSRQDTALEAFYDTLSAQPGAIAQWNHPGNQYGTFENFANPAQNLPVALLEVGSPSVSGYGDTCYFQALDKGWHVAPADNRPSSRTVLLAQSLTEEALLDAIRQRRVYATEDRDLEIRYMLDGFPLGSRLRKSQAGQTADIVARFSDPTDSAVGLVEIIADGGAVIHRQSIYTGTGELRVSLSPDYCYYCLRVTQPDGDVAITAPVRISQREDIGISGVVCQTPLPIQKEAVTLTLSAYNREQSDLAVDSVTVLADNTPVFRDTGLTRICAGEQTDYDLTFVYDGVGQTEITLLLSGTLDGSAREYSETLTLSFRQTRQVRDIIIDGSHGNEGLSDLEAFRTLAAKKDIRVTVAADTLTEELLKNCRFLLVTSPAKPFSDDFLSAVRDYVSYGGSLLVCGRSAQSDRAEAGIHELNRLLEAVGVTLRLRKDTVSDSIYHGATETEVLPEDIDISDPLCAGVTSGQLYRHAGGCSVSPGKGTALVTGRRTTQSSEGIRPVVLLAREETEAGGTVLAAGSLLPGSKELKEPSGIWDIPYANRTITENLLGIGGDALPLSTLQQAREAEEGTLLRIRGYVTAGTANAFNRFPNTLYLQDDTGGIPVMPFSGETISVGTPMEIIGVAEIREGNRVLKPTSRKVLNYPFYRYLPKKGSWKTLLDYDVNGGRLVQVEGDCTEVILSDSGRVSGIVLKDSSGTLARVLVEDCIFSGATGENDLHKEIRTGRRVRAMGLLHRDQTGTTVIRVRNCEEVVCIPPRNEYVNPKTGHWLSQLAAGIFG